MSLLSGIGIIHGSLIVFCLGMTGVCFKHYQTGEFSTSFTVFSCFAFIVLAFLLGKDLYSFKKNQQ